MVFVYLLHKLTDSSNHGFESATPNASAIAMYSDLLSSPFLMASTKSETLMAAFLFLSLTSYADTPHFGSGKIPLKYVHHCLQISLTHVQVVHAGQLSPTTSTVHTSRHHTSKPSPYWGVYHLICSAHCIGSYGLQQQASLLQNNKCPAKVCGHMSNGAACYNRLGITNA